MTLKSNVKFKGKLTRGMKNVIRYLVNFHVSSQKFGNLHFDGLLLFKAYKDLDEKVQKSLTLKSGATFEEKPSLSSKNDMRNSVNFNASSGKSENLHFDVLLLSITDSPKKVRKNYLS